MLTASLADPESSTALSSPTFLGVSHALWAPAGATRGEALTGGLSGDGAGVRLGLGTVLCSLCIPSLEGALALASALSLPQDPDAPHYSRQNTPPSLCKRGSLCLEVPFSKHLGPGSWPAVPSHSPAALGPNSDDHCSDMKDLHPLGQAEGQALSQSGALTTQAGQSLPLSSALAPHPTWPPEGSRIDHAERNWHSAWSGLEPPLWKGTWNTGPHSSWPQSASSPQRQTASLVTPAYLWPHLATT